MGQRVLPRHVPGQRIGLAGANGWLQHGPQRFSVGICSRTYSQHGGSQFSRCQ